MVSTYTPVLPKLLVAHLKTKTSAYILPQTTAPYLEQNNYRYGYKTFVRMRYAIPLQTNTYPQKIRSQTNLQNRYAEASFIS